MRARPFKGRAKIRLATWRDVRGEIAGVYKADIAGELPWQDATRAAHILSIIAQLDQGAGVDERLRQIEERIAATRPNGHDRTEMRT
jgi:hypothetical protein